VNSLFHSSLSNRNIQQSLFPDQDQHKQNHPTRDIVLLLEVFLSQVSFPQVSSLSSLLSRSRYQGFGISSLPKKYISRRIKKKHKSYSPIKKTFSLSLCLSLPSQVSPPVFYPPVSYPFPCSVFSFQYSGKTSRRRLKKKKKKREEANKQNLFSHSFIHSFIPSFYPLLIATISQVKHHS